MLFFVSRWAKLGVLLLLSISTMVFAKNDSPSHSSTPAAAAAQSNPANQTARVPILVYHNFNPTVPGSMNLTPARFKEQMQWIKDHHFTVIPLSQLVNYLQGKTRSLPAKSVVITADDGWESQYHYLVPIVREFHYPVTFFIYPGTISKSNHFMTWNQLQELQKTGEFDIQSHTLTHPNFKQEKKRLPPSQYNKFVNNELVTAKKILQQEMNKPITLLAWPFGIYNEDLEQQAAKAGYEMAFSIAALPTGQSFNPMAEPRYMIVAPQNMKTFAAILNTAR